MSAILRKYGASTIVLFPLITRNVQDFEDTAPSFASSDTQRSRNEGSFSNTSNSPSHEGNGMYSLALTSSEMQAARIMITVIDGSDPKLWEDQAILIDTYGHSSAQHAVDLDDGVRAGLTALPPTESDGSGYGPYLRRESARSSTASTIRLDTGANSNDDYYNDAQVAIISGTGAGQVRRISDYTGSSRIADIAPDWTTTPNSSSLFLIMPSISPIGAALSDPLMQLAQGKPSASPSLGDAVMLIYMAIRNQLDVTNQTKSIYNDAGVVVAKKTLTDDGTTYSEAEMESGP